MSCELLDKESSETFRARLDAAMAITWSVWFLWWSRAEAISDRGMHPQRDTSTVIFGDMLVINGKL